MNNELEKFYAQIEDVEIAMMTTRRPDGHLRSRAMANQKPAGGADLWFVTMEGAAKLADLDHDHHVNVAYYNNSTRAWVSVSGTAIPSRDRDKIHELYAADWKVWFPEEGDARHGTPDDPRMVLIGVTVHAAEFLEVNKSRPVLLYEFVKGWLSDQQPDMGEMHELKHPHRQSSAGTSMS